MHTAPVVPLPKNGSRTSPCSGEPAKIDRTGKGCVALCRSRFGVALGDGHGKLFEDVGEAAACDLVPLHGCDLRFGNDIADGGVHLLHGIGGRTGNEDILKGRHAVLIRNGVLIHRHAGERSAVEMEGYALHKTVLRGLDDLQVATLELVIEIHGGNLTGNHRNTAGFLRLMSKLISCQFNIDTACVELVFDDGSQISIDCTAVENEVADNRFQRSELDYLIYNDPLAYADLVLNGDPEAYLNAVTDYDPPR